MRVLRSVRQGPVTGVDFSTGMLAHSRRSAQPEARWVRADVRALPSPGGVPAFPVGAPQPVTSSWYWALLGFDLAMRVRNAVWRPPVRHVPPHLHAVRDT